MLPSFCMCCQASGKRWVHRLRWPCLHSWGPAQLGACSACALLLGCRAAAVPCANSWRGHGCCARPLAEPHLRSVSAALYRAQPPSRTTCNLPTGAAACNVALACMQLCTACSLRQGGPSPCPCLHAAGAPRWRGAGCGQGPALLRLWAALCPRSQLPDGAPQGGGRAGAQRRLGVSACGLAALQSWQPVCAHMLPGSASRGNRLGCGT